MTMQMFIYEHLQWQHIKTNFSAADII